MTFREFFDIHQDSGFWKKSMLYYRDKVDSIASISQEKPFVITYDVLKKNPDTFVSSFCNYMGVELDDNAKIHDKVHC